MYDILCVCEITHHPATVHHFIELFTTGQEREPTSNITLQNKVHPAKSSTMAYTASKEAFQACFDSMFVGAPEDAATDVLKLVVPEFTQMVDGKELTFDQFVGHVSHFRAAAKSVKTQVPFPPRWCPDRRAPHCDGDDERRIRLQAGGLHVWEAGR